MKDHLDVEDAQPGGGSPALGRFEAPGSCLGFRDEPAKTPEIPTMRGSTSLIRGST